MDICRFGYVIFFILNLYILFQAAFYDRDDVALKGFSKFYMDCAKEEHEHAEKLIKYQHLRGGKVVFQPIDRPAQDSWETPLAAMEYALNMEKQVNQVITGVPIDFVNVF